MLLNGSLACHQEVDRTTGFEAGFPKPLRMEISKAAQPLSHVRLDRFLAPAKGLSDLGPTQLSKESQVDYQAFLA